MKPLAARLMLFLALAAASFWPTQGNPAFELAPHLADGMVVQSGSETLFYGVAPPGERIRIEVKGKRFGGGRVTADKQTGAWSKGMNLGSASAQPVEIEFYLGNDKEPVRTVRDVLVGEVWIAAITLGEGIAAGPQLAVPNLRFAKYQGLEPGAPGAREAARWRAADAEGLSGAHFDLFAYKLAREISDKRGVPVGVIHVNSSEAVNALRAVPGPAFPDLAETMLRLRKEVYDDTYAALQARNTRLRANKRAGIVTEDPQINLYKKYRLYAPGQLQKTDFLGRLAFRGVLAPDAGGE